MKSRDSSVNIISLFVFTIIFYFSDFVDNSLFGGEIMCCSIEIQSNLAYKYIAPIA